MSNPLEVAYGKVSKISYSFERHAGLSRLIGGGTFTLAREQKEVFVGKVSLGPIMRFYADENAVMFAGIQDPNDGKDITKDGVRLEGALYLRRMAPPPNRSEFPTLYHFEIWLNGAFHYAYPMEVSYHDGGKIVYLFSNALGFMYLHLTLP
jgi:hypothetical protein